MARGIVVGKPATGGAGSTGRIAVTDGTGKSDPVSGAVAVAVDPGTEVPFTEDTQSTIGDIVDFTYDGKSGSGLKTFSKSAVITGSYQDNITVGAGESTLILAGNVEGKITVNGGILVIAGSSYIEGKIETPVDNSYVIVSGSSIEGKLDVSSASTMVVRGSTVEGKISSNNNIYAAVANTTVNGKLEVLNAKTCRCSNNTVAGDTNTPGC